MLCSVFFSVMDKGQEKFPKISRAFFQLENFVVHQRRSSQGYGTFKALQFYEKSHKVKKVSQ